MLKNTKDIIGGYMLNFISKRRRLYVKSHRRYNFFKFVFPIIRMGAIRYSCPVRLVSTYILPAKDIRLWGKFQPDSFKTERLNCVETDGQTDRRTWLDRRRTDGQTDMARSTSSDADQLD